MTGTKETEAKRKSALILRMIDDTLDNVKRRENDYRNESIDQAIQEHNISIIESNGSQHSTIADVKSDLFEEKFRNFLEKQNLYNEITFYIGNFDYHGQKKYYRLYHYDIGVITICYDPTINCLIKSKVIGEAMTILKSI